MGIGMNAKYLRHHNFRKPNWLRLKLNIFRYSEDDIHRVVQQLGTEPTAVIPSHQRRGVAPKTCDTMHKTYEWELKDLLLCNLVAEATSGATITITRCTVIRHLSCDEDKASFSVMGGDGPKRACSIASRSSCTSSIMAIFLFLGASIFRQRHSALRQDFRAKAFPKPGSAVAIATLCRRVDRLVRPENAINNSHTPLVMAN